MTWPTRIWLLLALLYGAFFSWYTSFAGPLTDEEIAHYMAVLESGGASGEGLARWKHFMETDTGDDFLMLNAIDYHETPVPGPGVEPGETSEQVMAKYARPFLGQAMRSGAHPVVLGDAAAEALDLWGIEGAQQWTSGGFVRYRSRRDVMEQALYVRGLDVNIHDFKVAAMEKTIAFPVDPFFQLGDPRFLLALMFTIVGLSVQLASTRARLRLQGS